MEKVGFIGGYSKIDLILSVAKILATYNKKVLVIDTTLLQKAKYVVPSLETTFSYITEFEGFDVAVGFKSIDHLKDYLNIDESQELDYDVALIDIDDPQIMKNMQLPPDGKNYFVTAFDTYSLKRGMEAIEYIDEPIKLTKVLFEKDMTREQENYLEYLSLGKKVVWDDQIIYFPLDIQDSLAFAENQRISKIKFRNISNQYKQGIAYLISHLTGTDEKAIRNVIKNIE